MKTILIIAALAIGFVSCKKEKVAAPIAPVTKPDTIADGTRIYVTINNGSYKVNTEIVFDHTTHAAYVPGEDAPESSTAIMSETSDGVTCAINYEPYTTKYIPLDYIYASGKSLTLSVSQHDTIPASLHFWLKDIVAGDSTDLRKTTYTFTSSSVKPRFSIAFK